MCLRRAASCSGLSATTIWMVLQFGLAMMPLGRSWIAPGFDLGHDQRTLVVAAPGAGVVDHDRAARRRDGRVLARHGRPGTEQSDVDALERVLAERLYRQLAAAEGQLLARRPLGSERDHALGRESSAVPGCGASRAQPLPSRRRRPLLCSFPVLFFPGTVPPKLAGARPPGPVLRPNARTSTDCAQATTRSARGALRSRGWAVPKARGAWRAPSRPCRLHWRWQGQAAARTLPRPERLAPVTGDKRQPARCG